MATRSSGARFSSAMTGRASPSIHVAVGSSSLAWRRASSSRESPVFAFVRTADLRIWISLGLVACVLFPIFLATLYRLLIRKASLEIGPDGIFDSGSLLWSGVGLIRWDEILAVFPTTRSSGRVKQHFLDIMVTDLPEIRKRLPLLKRLALSSTYSRMSQVLIGQSLLATPVDDLAQQVDQYVATHAPPGWRDRAAEGSVDHQLDDNDA